MVIYVLCAVVIIVVAVAIMASRQPDEFRVTRSATFNTTPDVLFPHVNNLKLWQEWSPWSRMDPNADISTNGQDTGVGASLSWNGKKTGMGTMTIIESEPNNVIRFRLDFKKPMVATNTAEFTFTPQGNQTLVTWTMYGPNNTMGKLMGLVMNCDKIVGGQFEDGLKNLKQVVKG
jgi:Polyketide cyclase / dehydrase and lipid transport